MKGSDHGSASGGGVFAETGFPKESRQKKKKPGPTKLYAKARHPGFPGDGSAKRGGREPVLVRKGENPGSGEKRGGKQVEGKDVSAGEKFEGVDEKDESADIQQPKGDEGETEGQAELEKSGSDQGGDPVDPIEGMQFKRNGPGKKEKAEGDRQDGGREVGAAPGKKEGSAVQPIRKGAKQDGIEHSLANFPGDLKIIIGGGTDGLDHEENGVIGEETGQGVGPDGFFSLKNRLPENPGNEKGHCAEKGAEKVVPAIRQLALKPDGKYGGKCGERGHHERRRRWAGRMPSSVRYLAMVRRAMGIPRSRSISSKVASE
jgi:hypothetical protein